MATITPPRWAFWAPKPIAAKGTAKAAAAGDAIFRRTGVNKILKEAVKASIRNDCKPTR